MKPKYVLPFSASDGRCVDMELCCFCQKLKNLKMSGDCRHFEDDYVDNACSGFVKVNDVAKRIDEILDCRCGKNKRNDTVE